MTDTTAKRLTCEVLLRVQVSPNEKDIISPSTQWEIDTNPAYQQGLGCKKLGNEGSQ